MFLKKNIFELDRIGSTVTTMFFALYALGENDDFAIEPFENQLTPDVGFLLFGMFHISNITILFSMLIAMMTKSFERILVSSGNHGYQVWDESLTSIGSFQVPLRHGMEILALAFLHGVHQRWRHAARALQSHTNASDNHQFREKGLLQEMFSRSE